MSQQCDSPKTFIAGEILAAWRRVKITAAQTVSYADCGNYGIGVTQAAAASAANVDVRLDNHGGTHKVTADGVISAGAAIYSADDGKVSASVFGSSIGTAVTAATADGDTIEAVIITQAPAASSSSVSSSPSSSVSSSPSSTPSSSPSVSPSSTPSSSPSSTPSSSPSVSPSSSPSSSPSA